MVVGSRKVNLHTDGLAALMSRPSARTSWAMNCISASRVSVHSLVGRMMNGTKERFRQSGGSNARSSSVAAWSAIVAPQNVPVGCGGNAVAKPNADLGTNQITAGNWDG